MSLYESDIEECLRYYQGLVNFYKHEIENGPPGSLRCQKSHGKNQFLHIYHENGKLIRRGINREPAMLRALARKEFAKRALKVLEVNVASLKSAAAVIEPFDIDAILKSMPKGYALLPEDYFFAGGRDADTSGASGRDLLEIGLHLGGETQARIARHRAWGEQPFQQSRYHEENKTIKTSRGVWVKSKSEALILEQFNNRDIPVRYEQVQTINGIVIAPDFTFEGADGELFYWEHVGMLDKENYARNNYDKLKRYYRAGLLPGDNLILSFERHGTINMTMINALIENEVIPRL